MILAQRKLGIGLAVFGGLLFGSLLFGHAHASALWCDVMANPVNPTSGTDANCTAGQNETALYGVGSSKTAFESYIDNKLENGYGFQRIGARFIINGLGGADWKDRLNNPDVTLSIETYSSCLNSAYDPSTNSDRYYSDCVTSSSLVFRYKGVIKYVIKRDCGNPLGNLAGLPEPPPKDHMPTGYITVACNPNGTADLTYHFNDSDGSGNGTAAYTRITPVGKYSFGPSYSGDTLSSNSNWTRQGYGTSPNTQRNVAGNGSVEAWLYIADVGPSAPNQSHGNNYYRSSDSPQQIRCPQPGGGGGGPPVSDCPLDPAITTNETNHRLSIPAKSHSPTYSGSISGYSNSPGIVTGYSYTPSGKFQVTNVHDQYGQATSYSPTGVSGGPFTADYSTWIRSYPYDSHNITADYREHYDRHTYKSSTTRTYYCSGSYFVSGNKCYYYYPVNYYYTYTCPSGQTKLGYSCYTYTKKSGYVYQGPATANLHHSCPWGGYYTSSGCGYTWYYAPWHFAIYEYSTQLDYDTQSQTQAQTPIGECYYRKFNITGIAPSVGLEDAAGSTNRENPVSAQANVNSGGGTIVFSVGHSGRLRNAYRLNSLPYSGQYYSACTSSFDRLPMSASGGTGTASETDSFGINNTPDCTNLTPRPPVVGSRACVSYSMDARGVVDENGNYHPGYSDSGNYIGPSSQISRSGCSLQIENEPYLHVYGGDVQAGNGFDTGSGCTTGNGSIEAFNNGGPANYTGAGTELSALALTNINSFATVQHNGFNDEIRRPSGLAFANQGASGNNYGGGLSGYNSCIPNYYGQHAGSSLPAGNVSVGALNGSYQVNGDINNLSGTVSSGHQVVLYVRGNVFLANPGVRLNASGVTAANLDNMPSFTLVVQGNIYIDSSITRLDGNYIAQGGTIYDCATSVGTASTSYGTCSNKLTVNGAFVAQNIGFYRAGQQGSLRFAGSDSGPARNNASEEFDYSPANWLAPPAGNAQPPKYDSITSLPPVL